jgi:hypothetical protein
LHFLIEDTAIGCNETINKLIFDKSHTAELEFMQPCYKFKHSKTFKTPAIVMTCTDQVNPVESYDPLLMSNVKSTSISVDEGEETGERQAKE